MKYFLALINSLSLVIVFLFLSIQIPSFFTPFYKYEYKKLNVYESVKMTEDDLMAVTKHLLSYLNDKVSDLNIETVVDGQTRMFFNDRELAHMEDVKHLFYLGFSTRNIALTLLVISYILLMLNKTELKFILKFYRFFFSAFIVIMGAVTAFVALDFSSVFTLFHKLSFSNDLWLLDPRTDLLINIVPLNFFIDISVAIVGLFLFFMILTVAIGIIVPLIRPSQRKGVF